MERQSLSIRQFADVCSVSHTEIARKMKALNIEGSPQGPGKPTLLSPDEQDQIAQTLFIPAEQPPAPQHQTEVVGSGLSIYQPPSLATRGSDSGLARNIQQQQLTQALQGFKANQDSFKDAFLGMATEQGVQLGHAAFVSQMSAAMATFTALQQQTGADLGVVASPKPAADGAGQQSE